MRAKVLRGRGRSGSGRSGCGGSARCGVRLLEEWSFDQALLVDPRCVAALNGKGIALDELGRHGDAQAEYRSAWSLAPDDRAVLNNLALSLALSGQYDEAIALLTGLVQDRHATPRNRQNLALALSLKGDDAGAQRVARADLDDAAVSNNLRYLDTVRRLETAAK